MKLTWRDTEDIAIALSERYPDTDPLTVRFTGPSSTPFVIDLSCEPRVMQPPAG